MVLPSEREPGGETNRASSLYIYMNSVHSKRLYCTTVKAHTEGDVDMLPSICARKPKNTNSYTYQVLIKYIYIRTMKSVPLPWTCTGILSHGRTHRGFMNDRTLWFLHDYHKTMELIHTSNRIYKTNECIEVPNGYTFALQFHK